jgi:uncharacterized protein YjbJ (UPF0337 family)
MNEDKLKGKWKEVKGKAKERWGKLTDDDLKLAEGRRDQLAGALQKRYGIAKEQAKAQVEEFARSCGC